MNRVDELDLLLESHSSVLSIYVQQRFVVEILEKKFEICVRFSKVISCRIRPIVGLWWNAWSYFSDWIIVFALLCKAKSIVLSIIVIIFIIPFFQVGLNEERNF